MHPVDLDLSILMKPAMIYTVLVIIAITKLKKKMERSVVHYNIQYGKG